MSNKITHPTASTCWLIESSHLAQVPVGIIAGSLTELRGKIQAIADNSTSIVPFKQLDFRYEIDDTDEVVVVHAYFVARNNTKKRFMRLRAEDTHAVAA